MDLKLSSELLNANNSEPPAGIEKLLTQSGLGVPDSAGLQAAAAAGDATFKVVHPTSGYCLKTKTDKNEKFFINVCTAEEVKRPDPLSDEDLVALLNSDDPSGFRVPMSIGELHAELDKTGSGCTAVDVIIHPEYLRTTLNSSVHDAFFLSVLLEGIEAKYQLSLSREWVKLKNKKAMGTLQTQNVRTQSKPFIMEMDQPSPAAAVPQKKAEVKPNAPEPEFFIVQEPATGHPDFLVAEIQLPKVSAASGLELDVGEDRLLLQTRAQVYFLDVFLPFSVVTEDVFADFNRQNKVLTVTMPVEPVVSVVS